MWKKQRRRELVYLRRSELGMRIFGKSQKRVLGKVEYLLLIADRFLRSDFPHAPRPPKTKCDARA